MLRATAINGTCVAQLIQSKEKEWPKSTSPYDEVVSDKLNVFVIDDDPSFFTELFEGATTSVSFGDTTLIVVDGSKYESKSVELLRRAIEEGREYAKKLGRKKHELLPGDKCIFLGGYSPESQCKQLFNYFQVYKVCTILKMSEQNPLLVSDWSYGDGMTAKGWFRSTNNFILIDPESELAKTGVL